VRFVDFIKGAVLLSAGAATALAAVTILGAAAHSTPLPALVSIGWWIVTGAIGLRIGRRGTVSPAIGRLLAAARPVSAIPEQQPGRILMNRLWALLLYTLASAGLGVIAPQIPGIACGLPLVLALSLSRQDRAVAAIEDRDGARFFVAHTSPLKPMALERTTWFAALHPQQLNGAAR
jgi:hypothetical protein